MMVRDYNHVTYVNLLQNSRSYEKTLTDTLEALLNTHRSKYNDSIYYVDFDFHAICKGNNYHKLDILMEQIVDLVSWYSWFSSREGVE